MNKGKRRGILVTIANNEKKKKEEKHWQLLVRMNKEERIVTFTKDELRGSAKRLKTTE
jgi:hypothetical protein